MQWSVESPAPPYPWNSGALDQGCIQNEANSLLYKPMVSGHLRDRHKWPRSRGHPFNRGFKNCALFVNDVMMFINIQRLLCTVIKFHVDKEAKEAVLYFVQDFKVNFDRG